MGERVPVTPMVKRYRALKAASQRERLAEAQRLSGIPRSLARDFGASVELFAKRFDSDEDFYPPRSRKPLPKADGIGSTVEVAARLSGSGKRSVLGAEELSFVYVDREIVPARTTSGAVFDDGKPISTALRLDLLLANAKDRVPIVGEVKVAMDRDPYFALIQALTLAAHLATPSQRRRLSSVYGRQGKRLATDGKLDVYLLFSRTPAAGTYWFDLREAARRLSSALMDDAMIDARIRRIAALDLDEIDGRLRISKRFAYPDDT
jgi:hypothetical protein